MCRFLVYRGRDISMSDLLLKTEQSLIIQSYKARERKEPLNGDGFGVGWYAPEIDSTPCVYTSIQPAWSNRNLFRLAEKIRSSCFFAHVRAATAGSYVSEFNCHPFQHEQFLWMHNGRIAGFRRIKRMLRESLDDRYYDFIQGTTDSEHAFAVFLNKLGDDISDYSINDLADALLATIEQINDWQRQAEIDEPSSLNFALSDGYNILVSRYGSQLQAEAPQSLYLSTGDRFEILDGSYRMRAAGNRVNAVIIASEPLTAERQDWLPVEDNQLVMVSPELHVKTLAIT